ncbi:winged helix-turn-helix domain-containing protein [Primorskyibacter aestuariivivens]|uniref:winged helix-turn-helix domain-containing tetratricopeptide repeat protein n=1 Tax=Primorskyibacter aestuariivivens TaxID=1888912 RepID=UPI0023008E67|nr:winged helix-turn-helix domain-containing protein [Primorskyibacter aestuariivivens]MDA7427523.1 winged helix-turn-helix domain-containing protein [Primorskyibacter aestuariivivens]
MSEIAAEKSGKFTEKDRKSAAPIRLYGLLFDPATRSLKQQDGTSVPLRAQSAEVLGLLIEANGEIVTKDRIIARIWPDTYVTEDSLLKCIADIRRALGDTDRSRLQTLPKVGYRLALAQQTSHAARAGRVGALPILAAVVCMLVMALWWIWPWPAPNTLADKPRIAVMAFDDFSAGNDKGYLSDAIAEGLITELARFPTIAVISRTSSFTYRNNQATIGTIGEELRVHYVLEGSQQKAGDSLRITAQLIDTRTGAHVWAETYDRKIGDFFSMQEEIVRGVVAVVADIVVSRPLPASDLKQVTALRYFLESKGSPDSRAQIEDRFALGDKALDADPDSEWGYLIHSWAHRHMAVFFSTPEEKSVHLAKSEEFADKAIEIAPKNYFGHWVRARVQSERGDHEASVETYSRAISLNPSDSHLLVSSSSPLLYTGLFDEGLAVIDRALDLDPKHADWFHWQRAWALWELRRCDDALAAFGRMSKIYGGAHRMLAATHACLGQKAEAVAALKVYLQDNPDATLAAEAEKLRKTWPNPPSVERWLQDMAYAGMPN